MGWDGELFHLAEADELIDWHKDMRRLTKVTITDVAEAMGKDRLHVGGWENRRAHPNLRNTVALVEAHGSELWIVKRGRIHVSGRVLEDGGAQQGQAGEDGRRGSGNDALGDSHRPGQRRSLTGLDRLCSWSNVPGRVCPG